MSKTKKKAFSLSGEVARLTGLNMSELAHYCMCSSDEAVVINPTTKEYRGIIVTFSRRGLTIIFDTFLGTVFATLKEKIIMQKMPDQLIINMNHIYQVGLNNLTSDDDYVTISGGKQTWYSNVQV